jgi:hypothetical protein
LSTGIESNRKQKKKKIKWHKKNTLEAKVMQAVEISVPNPPFSSNPLAFLLAFGY